MNQITSTLLMLRPTNFTFNGQAAKTNDIQDQTLKGKALNLLAQKEFDLLVAKLINAGIEVKVMADTPQPHTPDSIFPNNWFSTHEDGRLILYPVAVPNRRAERGDDILEELEYKTQCDLTHFEANGEYLESTGCIIFDRQNKIMYVALSERAHKGPIQEVAEILGMQVVLFETQHPISKKPIYHSNVLMTLGERVAVLCLDIVTKGKEQLVSKLKETRKEILEISVQQMNHFAGNMLQVKSKEGQKYWVMSESAHQILNPAQLNLLKSDGSEIISSDLSTVQKAGGGSARCMIAELF